MARLYLYVLAFLAVLWVLLQLGVLPPQLAMIAARILGLACTLACPLFFLTLYLAPGMLEEATGPFRRTWHRLRTHRLEIEDLKRKIARLDKAHHMVQLGMVYARQEQCAKAEPWFRKALEKESDLLEARYRLALCRYDRGDYREAADLLEQVHAESPGYDYGLSYLRLAQAQQHLGNEDRASEIYDTLLRYYPGHAEGSYHYAQLLAHRGETARAAELLRELIVTVRHSPAFQRRRNRHWYLKAHWWLWRHRA